MLLVEAPVAGVLPATDLDRARQFWRDLGLREVWYDEAAREVGFQAGGETFFTVYERPEPTRAEHTVLGFDVPDLDMTMDELKSHGVGFEDYDLPYLKTEGGVARWGEARGAWFKDTEGNVIAVTQGARAGKPAMAGRSSSGDIGM